VIGFVETGFGTTQEFEVVIVTPKVPFDVAPGTLETEYALRRFLPTVVRSFDSLVRESRSWPLEVEAVSSASTPIVNVANRNAKPPIR